MLERPAEHQWRFNARTQPAISYSRSRAVRDLRFALPSAFREQLVNSPSVGIRRVRSKPEVIPQGVLISGSTILAQISGRPSLSAGAFYWGRVSLHVSHRRLRHCHARPFEQITFAKAEPCRTGAIR